MQCGPQSRRNIVSRDSRATPAVKRIAFRVAIILLTMLICGVLGGFLAILGLFVLVPYPDPCPPPCDMPAMVAIAVADFIGLPVGLIVGLIVGLRFARRWVPSN